MQGPRVVGGEPDLAPQAGGAGAALRGGRDPEAAEGADPRQLEGLSAKCRTRRIKNSLSGLDLQNASIPSVRMELNRPWTWLPNLPAQIHQGAWLEGFPALSFTPRFTCFVFLLSGRRSLVPRGLVAHDSRPRSASPSGSSALSLFLSSQICLLRVLTAAPELGSQALLHLAAGILSLVFFPRSLAAEVPSQGQAWPCHLPP